MESYTNDTLYVLDDKTKVICNNSMGYWGGTEESSEDKCKRFNSNAACKKSADCSGSYHVYYPIFTSTPTYNNGTNALRKNKQIDATPNNNTISALLGRNISKPTSGPGSALSRDPKIEFKFLTANNTMVLTLSPGLTINKDTGKITGQITSYSNKHVIIKVIVTYIDPLQVKIHQIVELTFK